MSETKPTAGALRAAKEIALKTIIRSEDNVVVSYASITQVAQIIDREMAGPKVEELVKAACSICDFIDAGVLVRNTQNDDDPQWAMNQIPLLKAIAALSKAREVEAALKGSPADNNSDEVRKARGAQ